MYIPIYIQKINKYKYIYIYKWTLECFWPFLIFFLSDIQGVSTSILHICQTGSRFFFIHSFIQLILLPSLCCASVATHQMERRPGGEERTCSVSVVVVGSIHWLETSLCGAHTFYVVSQSKDMHIGLDCCPVLRCDCEECGWLLMFM